MAVGVEIDVEVLRCEIKRTYARVSQEPDEDFIFPTGRAWAFGLGYPPDLLARVPEAAAESFAGVANPFSRGTLDPGEVVLDVGSGAGTDSLVAETLKGMPLGSRTVPSGPTRVPHSAPSTEGPVGEGRLSSHATT